MEFNHAGSIMIPLTVIFILLIFWGIYPDCIIQYLFILLVLWLIDRLIDSVNHFEFKTCLFIYIYVKKIMWDIDQSRWSLLAFERWTKRKQNENKEYYKLDSNLHHPTEHYGHGCNTSMLLWWFYFLVWTNEIKSVCRQPIQSWGKSVIFVLLFQ